MAADLFMYRVWRVPALPLQPAWCPFKPIVPMPPPLADLHPEPDAAAGRVARVEGGEVGKGQREDRVLDHHQPQERPGRIRGSHRQTWGGRW